MKRSFFLLLLCTFSIVARSQEDSLRCVKEINDQVWKPFTAHLISGDKAAFASVHSKRITRVQIDDAEILDYSKYFPVDTARKPARTDVKRQFELRFDKRICNGTKAWESGYYKGTVLREGKPPYSYYGRFFVVLEKENGVWKILVDADTDKGAGEESFSKASPIQ